VAHNANAMPATTHVEIADANGHLVGEIYFSDDQSALQLARGLARATNIGPLTVQEVTTRLVVERQIRRLHLVE
jgi:hypothetical protein